VRGGEAGRVLPRKADGFLLPAQGWSRRRVNGLRVGFGSSGVPAIAWHGFFVKQGNEVGVE